MATRRSSDDNRRRFGCSPAAAAPPGTIATIFRRSLALNTAPTDSPTDPFAVQNARSGAYEYDLWKKVLLSDYTAAAKSGKAAVRLFASDFRLPCRRGGRIWDNRPLSTLTPAELNDKRSGQAVISEAQPLLPCYHNSAQVEPMASNKNPYEDMWRGLLTDPQSPPSCRSNAVRAARLATVQDVSVPPGWGAR